MAITDNEFKTANARAAAKATKTPHAVSARYDLRSKRIVVELNTHISIAFLPSNAQGLEDANPQDLADIEISPTGLGLHFPALDADVYIPALLEGVMGSKKWMASRMGQAGGRSMSTAKANASRNNGRLGGRPRKSATEQAPQHSAD